MCDKSLLGVLFFTVRQTWYALAMAYFGFAGVEAALFGKGGAGGLDVVSRIAFGVLGGALLVLFGLFVGWQFTQNVREWRSCDDDYDERW